jgi:hypothetical protein
MKEQNKLGLVVSYYLSRFDKEAYLNLGFGKQKQTHLKIGKELSINVNTIKNWRDEFDPIHGHRVGWYQKAMLLSRVNVVNALQSLNEYDLRLIVLDILNGTLQNHPEEKKKLLSSIEGDESEKTASVFILRGPTGKKAEQCFINHYHAHSYPAEGELFDMREYGVGYDFRIETLDQEFYIEVKGIAEIDGGILFTSKEWEVAKIQKEKYYLCIVSNLNEIAQVDFINNPYHFLNPKRNIFQSIQINYSISKTDLKSLI